MGCDRDFVELHNRTVSTIDLTDRALHGLTESSAPWVVVDLTGETLGPSGFLLAQLGRSTFAPQTGMDLPVLPDVQGPESADLDGSSTVVALRPTNAAVADGTCNFVDAVDLFGALGMPCSEGTGDDGGPLPTQAIQRTDLCADGDNNSAGFSAVTVAGDGALPPNNSFALGANCPACE